MVTPLRLWTTTGRAFWRHKAMLPINWPLMAGVAAAVGWCACRSSGDMGMLP
jgi:hypothetical protein